MARIDRHIAGSGQQHTDDGHHGVGRTGKLDPYTLAAADTGLGQGGCDLLCSLPQFLTGQHDIAIDQRRA